MDLHSLKTWHWVALGALAGALLGFARLAAWSDEPIGGPGFISQGEFESELNLPAVMGRPHLRRIVVHRRLRVDLVSLQRLDVVTLNYQPLLLAAPRPYRPLSAAWSHGAVDSVRAYLTAITAENADLTFQTAWWEAPPLLLLLWAGSGVLFVGGIWPVLLRLMAGDAGRQKEEEYDLDRFEPEAAAAPERSEAPDGQLEQLEAELVAALEQTPSAPDSAVPAASPPAPAVRELAAPVLTSLAADAIDDKEYAGEFYPVEKRGGQGFSLAELLVVLAISAFVVAMLLPTIRTARLQAQTVQCMAQLNELGKALQSYCNANQGWLPAWSGWHTWPPGGSDDSPGPAWTLELIPQIGKPDSPVYNCPSFPGPQRCRNYFLAAQWSGRSHRNTMKLSDVTMTSRFVLAGDKTQRGLYPPPFGTSEHLSDDADPDDSGDGMPVLAWPWELGGFYMHRGGNNILFDDMHVATFAAYDPLGMTFNPRRMENWGDVTPN